MYEGLNSLLTSLFALHMRVAAPMAVDCPDKTKGGARIIVSTYFLVVSFTQSFIRSNLDSNEVYGGSHVSCSIRSQVTTRFECEFRACKTCCSKV